MSDEQLYWLTLDGYKTGPWSKARAKWISENHPGSKTRQISKVKNGDRYTCGQCQTLVTHPHKCTS